MCIYVYVCGMQTENQLNEAVRSIRLESVKLSIDLKRQLIECDFEKAVTTVSEIQGLLVSAFTIERILK